MPADVNLLHDLLADKDPKWLMGPTERLVLFGLLEAIKPKSILEIGYRFGGCTRWFCRYAENVVTVDIDPAVLEASSRYANVSPLHTTSRDAFEKFAKENRRFDFCIIDGDHSEQATEIDLRLALGSCDVILLHDSSNPECRRGYIRALAGTDVYHELDLVEGVIGPEGLWGGIGLVIPSMRGAVKEQFAQKISNFGFLEKEYLKETAPRGIAQFLNRLAKRARSIVGKT